MSKNAQHVVPNKEGGWSVRKAGAVRATKTFDSQRKAVEYARELARKQSSELYIHGKDGSIRGRDSYSGDPFPPRNGGRGQGR